MKVLRNQLLSGLHGKPILMDTFLEESEQPKPVIIFSHGFKGFKDWGHFNLFAETCVNSGFVFIKYNFAFDGTTPENPGEVTDMDAFGNNNLAMELDDLGVVIDHVLSDGPLQKEIDPMKVYLVGHSRGGGISILKAGEDKRVRGIVTWASVGEFGAYWTPEQVSGWKKAGVVYIENSRTKQQMPMYYQFYENYMANIERLNIRKAVEKLTIPFLAIHGKGDEVVPYTTAEKFQQWNPSVKVLLIENSDHTFEARHPFSGTILPGNTLKIVEATIKFFQGITVTSNR